MLLFLLLTTAASSTCNKYMCAPANIPMSPDTCIYGEAGVFYLQKCASQRLDYCAPIQHTGNSTCVVPSVPYLNPVSWPGEPCNLDMDCVYGICDHGLCVGKGQAENCEISDECDPGLFCKGGVCSSQLKEMAPCTNDFMCENNLGCKYIKNATSVCTGYLTVEPEMEVGICNNNQNSLCKHWSCYPGKNDSGYCIAEVSNAKPLNATCEQGKKKEEECLSTKDTQANRDYNGICSCSYGTLGNSFCSLFAGDKPMADYLKILQKWYSSTSIKNCNTKRRLSHSCMKQHWDGELAAELIYKELQVQNWAKIQQNDQCTEDIYLQEFQAAKASYLNWTKPTPDVDDWSVWMGLGLFSLVELLV